MTSSIRIKMQNKTEGNENLEERVTPAQQQHFVLATALVGANAKLTNKFNKLYVDINTPHGKINRRGEKYRKLVKAFAHQNNIGEALSAKIGSLVINNDKTWNNKNIGKLVSGAFKKEDSVINHPTSEHDGRDPCLSKIEMKALIFAISSICNNADLRDEAIHLIKKIKTPIKENDSSVQELKKLFREGLPSFLETDINKEELINKAFMLLVKEPRDNDVINYDILGIWACGAVW